MPAQTCGDFDCDAEVGEQAAREILALVAVTQEASIDVERAMEVAGIYDRPFTGVDREAVRQAISAAITAIRRGSA